MLVLQFFRHILSDPFLLGCSAVMTVLFALDLVGLVGHYFRIGRFRHFDFKTPIVSIGLFGTFFGVLVGLYGFDTNDIAASVPRLLEGLKFAFAISVLGMFLSLFLSIVEKFTGGAGEGDEILQSIDKKIGSLIGVIQSPNELVTQFKDLKGFLKSELTQINGSLDKALTQLAKGATEEVVQALERIITEFNQNLTDQFGENFKELNAACLKMVEWQDRYRGYVEATETRMSKLVGDLHASQIALDKIAGQNDETSRVCRQVADLIKTYDLQVTALATHLESCKALGQQAGEFLNSTEKALKLSTQNMSSFSKEIENSVSKQSAALAKLTKELDDQIPKTLGELEDVLTSITQQFATDYRSLFQFMTDKR